MLGNRTEKTKTMKNRTVKIATMALLIALQVVLSRFLSINLQFLKIGFSFVPLMAAGYIYGASGGVIVALVSDLIGALLFPSGAFFPGFTVTAVLSGFIYGLAFSGKCTTSKIVISVVAEQVLCSLLLNTWWLAIMYHSSFKALIVTRFWQALAMIVVEIIFAEVLFRRLGFMSKLKTQLLRA